MKSEAESVRDAADPQVGRCNQADVMMPASPLEYAMDERYGEHHAPDANDQMVHGDHSCHERWCGLVALACRHAQRRTFCDWAGSIPHGDRFHCNGWGGEPGAVGSRAGGERICVAEYPDGVEINFSSRGDAHALRRGRVRRRLCDGA